MNPIRRLFTLIWPCEPVSSFQTDPKFLSTVTNVFKPDLSIAIDMGFNWSYYTPLYFGGGAIVTVLTDKVAFEPFSESKVVRSNDELRQWLETLTPWRPKPKYQKTRKRHEKIGKGAWSLS